MTTDFQEKVYAKLRKVPKGKVTTYKHLADAVSCGSSQAIGQALKNNPYAPQTPCHRVVSTSGSIGGFSGSRTGKNITRKISLLRSEGVDVRGGEVVDFESRIFRFDTSSKS